MWDERWEVNGLRLADVQFMKDIGKMEKYKGWDTT